MYKDYFGLNSKPFSIAPDPHYLYMSERHREALAHLIYGLQTEGGFVLLTGEVGTGKTTICRCLLEQIPDDTEIAFVLNPKLTVPELLATICDELGIDYPPHNTSIKVFIDTINHYLLDAHAQGHKTVVIIDEAQNLSIDVLEQIRLLTNLETNKQKLLQVIMLGQPELKELLGQPELRQLAQRITARYHLEPLSTEEMAGYISHRLAIAGVERPLFTAASIRKLYQLSGGVPRLINLICDRALLGAYVQEQHIVKPKLLAMTAKEVFGDKNEKSSQSTSPHWLRNLIVLLGITTIAGVAGYFYQSTTAQIPTKVTQQKLQPSPDYKVQQTPPVPAALVYPEEISINDSLTLAQHELFKLWGYHDYQPKTLAGDYALQNGLRYLIKRGSLGTLTRLNRPAVLTLTNSYGQVFYATLTQLASDTATFNYGPTSQTVATSDLINQWDGEFALLWQPPTDYSSAIHPDNSGPMILWLERQFAEITQRTPNLDPALKLDGLLLEDLYQFQMSHGLKADGIVGPITLIHLNNTLNTTHPMLTNNREG
ncbi:MAG: peptidoglycan-binding protein [Desulfuromonadales bacterium C00003068]|jgi:general secretion pathway protein A|nr:MAG: peptidoglycan-binding protein [Desulfuromonadales bacterium C00003068]